MKRITALIICLVTALLFFSACSDNNSASNAKNDNAESTTVNSYIGYGFKETLSLLVESNRIFVEEVFIDRTLTVDAENPKKDGLTTYYPVISDTIPSYSALVSTVKATYIEEAANELLKDGIYKEIDGKLYCKSTNILIYEDTEAQEIIIEGISVTDEKCVFKTFGKNGEEIEMTAVYDNGTWKLDKVYTEI